MTYYRRVGDVPRKRHTVHRDASGERLHEELLGEEGFAGPSTLLYHRHPPSALVAVEAADDPRPPLTPLHPLAPMHLRTSAIGRHGDAVTGRHALLGNDDVTISLVAASTDSPLYRNATGDELVFVAEGAATLESSLGCLSVGAGDYVVVPAGLTHRWRPGPDQGMRGLVLESRGHVGPPSRHLTATGQFLEHAPYCERDLRMPDGPFVIDHVDHVDDGERDGAGVDVLVRTAGGMSVLRHRHHPFDVVGWDGCVYPWALSIHDFEPIVGSLHQPPQVHQTFEAPGIVVCSFVPRPFDFHPDAVKVPYHHANVDSDEVLFYVSGDFMSRAGSGIEVGSMTVHPAGFVHGPQPGSWERSVDATATNEVAVMVDTFRPLLVSSSARAIADAAYVTSWTAQRDPSR